ncbi:MAG: hypothetical protein ACLPXB_18715 [Thiobacillaceae bacterium]
MNIEQLERELLALLKAKGDNNPNARQRAALEAMGSLIRRAVETDVQLSTVASIVARNLGVSTRRARDLLQKYDSRQGATNELGSGHTDVVTDNQPRGGATVPVPPTVTLTSRSPHPVSSFPAVTDPDVKPLPPLPPDLMPKDGQMPPVPGVHEYRMEPRSDGLKVYVINGDRYSLLPGIDPTAPYGRYVDGRPMNEYGAPIGEGPPVMHGKFIGENY